MNNLLLELKLLKTDIPFLLIVIIGIPLLNTMLILKNIDFHTREPLMMLFGSVHILNWMYWVFFCFGYLILIQILWREREKYFEYNVIILQQTTSLLWMNRMFTGWIFTFIYIFISFLFAISGIIYSNDYFLLDFNILLEFISILINFYLHAIIWIFLNVYISSRIAGIIVLAIFYAGTKISEPYLPLYFSMIKNIGNEMLVLTLLSEAIVIFFLCCLILLRGKYKDYY